jgi:hypothetical protein
MKAYSMDLRERVVAACDARDGTRGLDFPADGGRRAKGSCGPLVLGR